MITLDALKRFDPTTIDLSRLDVRNVALPKFDMPKFDVRNVALPKFDMPKFDMPEIPNVDLPVDAERVAGLARDAAYVGVGAVVVVAQQADERLREFAETFSGAVSDAVSTAAETVTARVRQVVDAVR